MAQAGSDYSKRGWQHIAPSAAFRSRVEAAHADVELCLAALETSMAAATPDPLSFSITRLRLAKANLARTQVARECCGYLMGIAAKDGGDALRDLQQREIEHSQMVSDHVRHWTPQLLTGDWEGYCGATRRLLDRVRELIACERQLLLPLLGAAA